MKIFTLESQISANAKYAGGEHWMAEEIRRWESLFDAGYRFVAILARGVSHVHGPRVECVEISANLIQGGHGNNSAATRTREDAKKLIDYDEEKSRYARGRYVSPGVRAIIRECESIDRQDAALAAKGHTESEIMDADDQGRIDDFGNIVD